MDDAGKYIQYDIQGSAGIDLQLTNNTGATSVVYKLPGSTTFNAVVSSNITLKIDRGTTAYVDPWGNSTYVWLLHLMLNNTQILLPDFKRTVDYLNTTFGMPKDKAYDALAQLSTFNRTGLVAETWLIVDNRSGIMFWQGSTSTGLVHSALAPVNRSATRSRKDMDCRFFHGSLRASYTKDGISPSQQRSST